MIRFLGTFLLITAYLTAMVTIVFLKKDISIGNFTWGGGVTFLTIYTFLFYSSFGARQLLATLLILIWASRLTYHLILRYKKGADPRFIAWEKQWGKYAFLITFGWVVVLQGILLLIMATPTVLINTQQSGPLNLLDVFGYTLWIFGFYCESLADYQLRTFIQETQNKGRILSEGLWRYSRHPNYFGEMCMWLGLALMALSVPYGFLAFIAPITITGIFFFFSIPLLENVFAGNRQYQEYKKRTSVFALWFVKQ